MLGLIIFLSFLGLTVEFLKDLKLKLPFTNSGKVYTWVRYGLLSVILILSSWQTYVEKSIEDEHRQEIENKEDAFKKEQRENGESFKRKLDVQKEVFEKKAAGLQEKISGLDQTYNKILNEISTLKPSIALSKALADAQTQRSVVLSDTSDLSSWLSELQNATNTYHVTQYKKVLDKLDQLRNFLVADIPTWQDTVQHFLADFGKVAKEHGDARATGQRNT